MINLETEIQKSYQSTIQVFLQLINLQTNHYKHQFRILLQVLVTNWKFLIFEQISYKGNFVIVKEI